MQGKSSFHGHQYPAYVCRSLGRATLRRAFGLSRTLQGQGAYMAEVVCCIVEAQGMVTVTWLYVVSVAACSSLPMSAMCPERTADDRTGML